MGKAGLHILSIAVLLSAVSCAGRGEKVFEPLPFPAPKVPAVITDAGEVSEYVAQHYWDALADTSRTFPCDSVLVSGVRKTDVEQAYADYLAILETVSLDKAVASVARLFERISAVEKRDSSSNVFETLKDFTEKYMYDPNSPFRNEDWYFPFAKGLSESDLLAPEMRKAYGFDAEMCSLNRVGTRASDFVFSDRNGRTYTLYGIDADLTVLFFSNPGCKACKDIIDMLDSSGPARRLVADGKLAVLNIYIDSDLGEWYKYMPIYPEEWYNGYDPNTMIRDNLLYNVRAIPSLYLLDSDKVVLLKDVPPEKLLARLENAGL